MELGIDQSQIKTEKQIDMEVASIERLLRDYDEFFNFVNLNEHWYRWVSGKYTVTSVDSMGETLIKYIDKFCRDENILKDKILSSDRILVMNYMGVNMLFRKLDGKDEFSAVSIVENPTSVRIIYWNNFVKYLEKQVNILNEEALNHEIS
jgi:hypothetical protein